VIAVDDGDAILMAQSWPASRARGGHLERRQLFAALEAQDDLGGRAVVVTVFPDSNKKYLSTDLLREEPVRPQHRSPHVQLLGFRAINRVCDICFDPTDPASAPAGFFSAARNR
jgi:cysteine synthase A